MKLQQRYDEDNISNEYKISNMLDSIRKIEHNLKESHDSIENKCTFSSISEYIHSSRLAKTDKTIKKALEKLLKVSNSLKLSNERTRIKKYNQF
jgi:hypothetical protein